MEPDYNSLDPEERDNKFLSFVAIALGVLSLCTGLIPIFGIIISLGGIIAGVFGTRSGNRKLAFVGIAICGLGLLLSLVYGALLIINRQGTLTP